MLSIAPRHSALRLYGALQPTGECHYCDAVYYFCFTVIIVFVKPLNVAAAFSCCCADAVRRRLVGRIFLEYFIQFPS